MNHFWPLEHNAGYCVGTPAPSVTLDSALIVIGSVFNCVSIYPQVYRTLHKSRLATNYLPTLTRINVGLLTADCNDSSRILLQILDDLSDQQSCYMLPTPYTLVLRRRKKTGAQLLLKFGLPIVMDTFQCKVDSGDNQISQ
ncbi:hypothetical protein AVEN_29433-1 [Araneus ventricosus]|uniref:Uncharacterized protein n=1 Tax=Araneus ventricosus TaxID=182803 RepID=A0A4Y2CYL9_ARAVE|nr:hypothetical protein AVEN_29433-1 [Araneus ventricosus]